jgi:hypothetical protein
MTVSSETTNRRPDRRVHGRQKEEFKRSDLEKQFTEPRRDGLELCSTLMNQALHGGEGPPRGHLQTLAPKPALKMLSLSSVAASACLLVLLAVPANARAARGPTIAERAALTQATFDTLPRVVSKEDLAGTRISNIVVSTRSLRLPGGARFYYQKFAVVEIFNPNVGPGWLLFGYYVARVSGWRLLSGPGTSEVGCDVPDTLFHGYKRVVLKDLRLGCP